MPPKLFSFTHFRKNGSASPLVSHTFKTTIQPGMVVLSEHREPKDPSESCKPFRLIHFRKNVSANPLASTLTGFTLAKSFTSNTYEKHTQGEGVGVCLRSEHKSRVHESRITDHQSRVTDHAPRAAMVHSSRPLIGKRHDPV